MNDLSLMYRRYNVLDVSYDIQEASFDIMGGGYHTVKTGEGIATFRLHMFSLERLFADAKLGVEETERRELAKTVPALQEAYDAYITMAELVKNHVS